MARLSPTLEVLRALFAKSGNVCAFPDCVHPLIDDENLFVGQVCHIEAAEPGGERYNPAQTADQRRGYDNLLLLCYRHHIVTNNTDVYTVERLRTMKAAHEAAHSGRRFEADEKVIAAVAADMERYWATVGYLHEYEHAAGEFKAPVDVNATFDDVADSARQAVTELTACAKILQDDTLYHDALTFLQGLGYDTSAVENAPGHSNPFFQRSWDVVQLGLRNWLIRLSILIDQMDLLFTSERLKTQPQDAAAIAKLRALKECFLRAATHVGLAD